ncbi:divergent polysaccharide deacetylase family protein [uncultured Helicobacter sp.]|uniref:divergent polysaccharide deacetylase family protein n=1 Tax=uncultured Helicobacter sp. TaxID=175537 RepID=UPI00260D0C95|nr:divergent polysaccharide deacetylase family protein [uncultured Helicobacter sp.]
MDKVKPLTIGIIALLLILLTFNFIPTHKQNLTKTPQDNAQKISENNATLTTYNAELIQKNIDFLKEHLEHIKKDSTIPNPPQESTQNNALQNNIPQENTQQEQKPQIQKLPSQNPKLDSNLCVRHKPQLAIIIDDISNLAQYQALTQIPFKLTPSLFPKSKVNKDTPEIAKIAPIYMIHLPLEALNFYQKEHKWLFVNDSKETIESYIKKIKQDFPNLSYINNHTGSKFTQNLEAMTLLLETLNAHRINFIDSRTIAATKTTAAYANTPYIAFNPCQQKPLQRDVFLDNDLEIPSITQQLIQAVQIAKQKGYAIAIGHPHKATLLALKNAVDYLENSGIELVYINEIITP